MCNSEPQNVYSKKAQFTNVLKSYLCAVFAFRYASDYYSSEVNSPQPCRVLSTAPASTPTAYSSRMVPAYSNAPWPVTMSNPTGQWDAPKHSSRLGGLMQRHTAARPDWTRTPPCSIIRKVVTFQYIIPTHWIRLWPAWPFDLGGCVDLT